MTGADAWALAIISAALLVTAPPLGRYLAATFGDGPAPGDRMFGPVERAVHRVIGVDPHRSQTWRDYALSVVGFGLVSVLGLYLVLRIQGRCRSTPPTPPLCRPAWRSTPLPAS
jgi:potassium-transporting ATPase potassium-binding subunit